MERRFKDVAHLYLGSSLQITNVSIGAEYIIVGVYQNYLMVRDKESCPVSSSYTKIYWEDFVDKYRVNFNDLPLVKEFITVEGYNGGQPFIPIDEISKEHAIGFDEGGLHDFDGYCGAKFYYEEIHWMNFYVVNQLIQWHFNVFNILQGKNVTKIREQEN